MILYIMARADGWHKIGVSTDVAKRRKAVRADVVLKTYRLGWRAYRIERMSHVRMVEMFCCRREGEWFEASFEECVKAINSARRLHRTLGHHGWNKLVSAKWRKAVRESIRNG